MIKMWWMKLTKINEECTSSGDYHRKTQEKSSSQPEYKLFLTFSNETVKVKSTINLDFYFCPLILDFYNPAMGKWYSEKVKLIIIN